MICQLKSKLLEKEEGYALLDILMHFPNDLSLNKIIQKALKVRNKVYLFLKAHKDIINIVA
jgi:hypothetical protein